MNNPGKISETHGLQTTALVPKTLESFLFVLWNQEKGSSGFPSSMEDTNSPTTPRTNVNLSMELKEGILSAQHLKSNITSVTVCRTKWAYLAGFEKSHYSVIQELSDDAKYSNISYIGPENPRQDLHILWCQILWLLVPKPWVSILLALRPLRTVLYTTNTIKM